MTKNIQISFRLTSYQLAHGLEILRGLEPEYQPSSMTAMVKMIVEDWISKMSAATKPWPSDESLKAVNEIMQQTAAGRKMQANQNQEQELQAIAQDLARHGLINPEKIPPSSTETSTENKSVKQRSFKAGQTTTSITKVVTDFRPPTAEELFNEQEDQNEESN